MRIDPELTAGYDAASTILAGRKTTVSNPADIWRPPSNPMEMMASFPPAYSVKAVPLHHGINMIRHGRFGFDQEMRLVAFPVPHTDPSFVDRLREVLVPVAEELEATAQAEKLADYAKDAPGAVYESRDAIREVTD